MHILDLKELTEALEQKRETIQKLLEQRDIYKDRSEQMAYALAVMRQERDAWHRRYEELQAVKESQDVNPSSDKSS